MYKIDSENLRYATGTMLCSDLNEKKSKKDGVYVYKSLIHFAIQ